MNNRTIRFARPFGLLVLALAVAGVTAKADSFDVSLNTSSLSGTQVLAFSLISGGGGVTNAVTLSDFAFGGGSAEPPADYLGTTGVSGDLSGTINMNDSVSLYGGTALFVEQFDPGSSLSFLMNTTNNSAGTTPDAFSMAICNTSFSVCYSDDAGTGALLVLGLTGTSLSPSSFTLNAATAQGLPAPVVTEATSSGTVPEPSSVLLLALGVLAVGACSRRKRTAAML
jgi:PEP-CTERM motif